MIEISLHKTLRITGKTTINHRIRVQAGISAMEYCLLELIEKSKGRGDMFTEDLVWKRCGIDKTELYPMLKELREKGYLVKGINNQPVVTPQWMAYFTITEEEFEAFWMLGGKCAWPGSSRKDARQKYEAARRLYSPHHLIGQRDKYFAYCDKNTRFRMGASVFLGLDKEWFNGEWETFKPGDKIEEKQIKKVTLDEAYG